MKEFYLIASKFHETGMEKYFIVKAQSVSHAYERFMDYQRGYNSGAGVRNEWDIHEISLKKRRGITYAHIL